MYSVKTDDQSIINHLLNYCKVTGCHSYAKEDKCQDTTETSVDVLRFCVLNKCEFVSGAFKKYDNGTYIMPFYRFSCTLLSYGWVA